MALADRTKPASPAADFKKPDVTQFVPAGSTDMFQRIVAAGMKIMYSPEMSKHVQDAIQSQTPVPRTIADNTTGLMLTMDQKTAGQGGIPAPVLFPAAVELAAEVATILTAAKVPVSQQDFNDALLIIYAQVGKKLGASDDQLMQGAQQAVGAEPTGDPAADSKVVPPPAPAGAPGAPLGGAMPPGQPGAMPPPGMQP